jgi:hypothetical protein
MHKINTEPGEGTQIKLIVAFVPEQVHLCLQQHLNKPETLKLSLFYLNKSK